MRRGWTGLGFVICMMAAIPGRSEPPQPRRSKLVKVEAGFAYRWALSESFLGGAARIAVGKEYPRLEVGGQWGAQVGTTLAGLTFGWVTAAALLHWKVTPRLRLGIEPGLGALLVGRATGATRSGSVLWYLGPNLDLALVLDLTRPAARNRLYGHLRTGVGVLPLVNDRGVGSASVVLLAAAGLGFGFYR